MAFERFSAAGDKPFYSARIGFAVTPNDSTDLSFATKALYVGGTGDMKVIMSDGTTVTFAGLPAGTLLPIVATRVYTTDTTATSIVGLA